MGSLYEPSIRESTWSVIGRRISRRFTTLEGWREVGWGVYAMGGSNIRMFSLRHQFDTELFRDHADDVVQTANQQKEMESSQKSLSVGEFRGFDGPMVQIKSDESPGGFSIWQNEKVEQPYHVFDMREKWRLVAIVGAAGIFQALTFNIYLPTLNRIGLDFRVDSEAMNLTITAYLIVQGIAPLFWGPLSEFLGRRSVLIYIFFLYVSSSIVLSFSPNFPILIVFRGLQSASIASTVSVGAAMVRDISLPADRDGFYNLLQGVRNATLLVAPVLGGATSNWANFRCIFVILFALALTVLAAILFFLPETLRSIAGNGTLPLTGIRQPFIWRCKVFGKAAHQNDTLQPGKSPGLSSKEFLEPLRMLKEKDIVLSLLFSSMIYAIWMMVTVSTTSLFASVFQLKEAALGLAFLPNYAGTIAGSTLIGNLLNQDFTRACTAYKRVHSLPSSTKIPRHPLPADFPIEHMRLIRIPALLVIFIIALSLYGFTIQYQSLTSLGGWISIPLLLQFLIAAMAHAICGVHQTLVSDLWSREGCGAASVASTLIRSLFAAVGVAVVQKILLCIDRGPTFLALGLVVIVLVPVQIVQWYWGGKWRRDREAKIGNVALSSSAASV